jgi:hypothetical protein
MPLYKPSDHAWSLIFVLTGMCMVLIFKHFGVDRPCVGGHWRWPTSLNVNQQKD